MKITLSPVEIVAEDGSYIPLREKEEANDYSAITVFFDLILPENF